MFNYNKSKANTFGLLPEGEYIVTIESAKFDTTKTGKENISITSVINQGQAYAGRKIFWKYWKVKTPSQDDLSTEGYSFKMIMQLCSACNFQDGTKFNSVGELLALLPNKVVVVGIEHDEYNGSKYERVKFVSECCTTQTQTTVTENLEDFEEILSDGEIPF